jgi:SAM-dependent methyltransferase
MRRDAAELSHGAAPNYYLPVAERRPQPNHNSSGALAWISDTFRSRGLFGAVRWYAASAVELLRDLTPARRKSRYGDIDYDFEHGVDTTWANVSLRTRLRELLSGGQYQPSEPALFHEILNSMPVAVDGFTFIDLGSGKGRTLLMASEYPFRRIIGVELLVELNQIAQQNIARYRSQQGQKCCAIESHPGDARAFEFPREALVLYLFNPFPEHVLREVLANLHRSVTILPREVYVIYHNLVHENVFADQEWLCPVQRTHQFAIFGAEVRGEDG